MATYYRRQWATKPKTTPKFQKGVKYALRSPDGLYWNRKLPKYHSGQAWKQYWCPSFGKMVMMGARRDPIIAMANIYEAIRLTRKTPKGSPEMAPLNLVVFRDGVEVSCEPFVVDPLLIKIEMLSITFGEGLADSYKMLKKKNLPVDDYPYAFRRSMRKGEAQKLLEEDVDCIVQGPIVWVKHESDLIYFKMAHEDSLNRIYYIAEGRKSKRA